QLKIWSGGALVPCLEPFRNLVRERSYRNLAQSFQMWCKHFLLPSEIQIEREQQLVPKLITPTEFLIIRAQRCGRIQIRERLAFHKVKIARAVVIGGGALQSMANSGGHGQKANQR